MKIKAEYIAYISSKLLSNVMNNHYLPMISTIWHFFLHYEQEGGQSCSKLTTGLYKIIIIPGLYKISSSVDQLKSCQSGIHQHLPRGKDPDHQTIMQSF